MKGGYSRKSVLTGLASVALHYAAFSMGAVGLVMVIVG